MVDANSPWYVWMFIGLFLGFIASVGKPSLVSGLVLMLCIVGGPIYIVMTVGATANVLYLLLLVGLFFVGLFMPVSYFSWLRTKRRHEAFRKQLDEKNKSRGDFAPN